MSKWTDPSATVADDNHELRELRWRIKELNKVCGRQGETIHRLRGELADVRQLNSKIERGQVRNLERMLAWYQRDIEYLRAKVREQREILTAAEEPNKEAVHG